MSKTIWKYQIRTVTPITMPRGAKILTVSLDPGGVPCMWVECDPSLPLEERKFEIFGAGHRLPEQGQAQHVGTYLSPPFVWHVYEVPTSWP